MQKFIVIGIVLALVGGAFVFKDNIMRHFNPISIVASVSGAELAETDGRTNILVLGSDARMSEDVQTKLTDTILIASIGRYDNDVVMISLPRDLWVKNSKGYYSKINAVYPTEGSDELMNVIEQTLGIPIHYYAVVNFEIFRESIDILGGIEVDVKNGFTDRQYPVEGKEDAPLNERYQTVSFEPGLQTMDGETALKFTRSRHGDNNEGTDFARAARQQQVIAAIRQKALSVNTLINPTKIKELYNTYASNIDTNITFSEVQSFYLLSQEVDLQNIRSIVLDDRSAADEGGLLYAPEDTTLYNGQYVLVPRAGDFSQLHAYVQKFLFSK